MEGITRVMRSITTRAGRHPDQPPGTESPAAVPAGNRLQHLELHHD
jgi:hypothetical protein